MDIVLIYKIVYNTEMRKGRKNETEMIFVLLLQARKQDFIQGGSKILIRENLTKKEKRDIYLAQGTAGRDPQPPVSAYVLYK